ncbi:Phosphate transporter [Aphelenchoides besseyi]|nr:Phosphate transporter [Aphelenchoides besseyi]
MFNEITEAFQGPYIWAIVLGFILAFVLGFAQGANDVSNAFATSVGSKVLTLRKAYILATIMESLGTILVGYNVSDTVRKGVVDLELFKDCPEELMLGQLAIMGAASIWLLLATFIQAPVSTTHAIFGATLGFAIVLRGTDGIQWDEILKIVLSWVCKGFVHSIKMYYSRIEEKFICTNGLVIKFSNRRNREWEVQRVVSPVLSGLVSTAMYILIDHAVLRRRHPIRDGLRTLPIIYFICISFITFAVSYQGSKVLHLSSIPLWVSLLVSFGLGLLSALIFRFFFSKRLERWVNKTEPTAMDQAVQKQMNLKKEKPIAKVDLMNTKEVDCSVSTISSSEFSNIDLEDNRCNTRKVQTFAISPKQFIRWALPDRKREPDPKTLRLFSAVQIFTACLAGFSHGANDVSNAVAPLTALLIINRDHSVEQHGQTPLVFLLYGVFATCVGLCILGHKVIKKVGSQLSAINPSSGFVIEFGASVTVLIASKIGIPISTTHALVGSIVAVGCVRSGEGINWSIFRNIALSWFLTLPSAGVIAAGLMYLLKTFAL